MHTPSPTAFLLMLFLAATGTHAYNHPEIRWKSVTTAHFVINYYDKTEPAVYAAWKIAESAYEQIAAMYEYRADRKISLSLADYDDFSNGYASWTDGSIMIWVPESRFDLRNSNTWLRNVIAHELTHIITLENRKRMQVLAFTVSADYSDPRYHVSVQEPFARITAYPNWLAEGLAQLGSETNKGDCWDARRDMVLRCAVLDNRALTLDEMGSFNHDGVGNEQIYNQGYSLVRHLRDTYGQEKLTRIVRDAATSPANIDDIFRDRTGDRLEYAYRTWMDTLRARYVRTAPPNPTAAEPVWSNGTFNTQPRVSRDGSLLGWLTSQGDDFGRTDLVVVRGTDSAQLVRIPHAGVAWDFSVDGKTVYFVKNRTPDKNGSYLNDLFSRPVIGGGEKRLTWNKRIYDVAVAPDDRMMAVVFFDKGRYTLGIMRTDGTGLRVLMTPDIGSPFMHPCFDPSDPGRLVVGAMRNGLWQLMRVDVAAATATPLLTTPFQCESPSWGPDGRIWFNADFDGVFNIYSILPDGTGLRRHTTVTGGAFSPSYNVQKTILFSEYTARGFRIASIPADTGNAFEPPPAATCAYDSLDKPKGNVRINSRPYEARLLRPVWELGTSLSLLYNDDIAYNHGLFGQGAFSLALYRSDALQKKSLQLALQAGVVGGNIMQKDTTASQTPLRARPPHASHLAAGINTDSAYGISLAPLHRQPGGNNKALQRASSPMTHAATAVADTATPDSSRHQLAMLILQPQLSYLNAMHAPTIGFDLGVMMYTFIPVQAQSQLFLNWQASREVTAGIGLFGQASPFAQQYAFMVPMMMQWVHTGHLRKSVNYTLANVSQLTLQAVPILVPFQGVSAALQGGHGIPLLYNTSIIIGGDVSVLSANQAISDPLNYLPGYSHTYLDGGTFARLVFPLVPKINAGSWLYVDALYARLGWAGGFHANAGFMQNATSDDWPMALRGDPGRPGIDAYQMLEAAIMSDMTKSYLFSRRAEVAFRYSLLLDTWYLEAIFGF